MKHLQQPSSSSHIIDRSLLKATRVPLRRVVDLLVGEGQEVALCDGGTAKVKLLNVEETSDSACGALRSARVKVAINGERLWLPVGNYSLPTTAAGAMVDCTVTRGYGPRAHMDCWALEKDARLRLWPEGSCLLEPGTFAYPARQRWFASATQMSNEPVHVDGGDRPGAEKIYYHAGLDIGGVEGKVDVLSAADGIVLSSGDAAVLDRDEFPVEPRYDRVYLLDAQGWVYQYSHLMSTEDSVQVGQRVGKGRKIGVLGKEGTSGGWAHLHFGIWSRQPTGRWGAEEGYAYLWQAYVAQHHPPVFAVARPHYAALAGEKVYLDGSRSWSAHPGGIRRYAWTLADGSSATGPTIERTYERPGVYSEILWVTDADGNESSDFSVVHVFDRSRRGDLPPTIHAAYAPTFAIGPGDQVTFVVRAFRTGQGRAEWDFGDGSPPVAVDAPGDLDKHDPNGYGRTTHRYEKPGRYLVRVERVGGNGMTATAHLDVCVGADTSQSLLGRSITS